jgi:hypothetical protein
VPDAQAPGESQDPVISIGVLAERVGLSVSAVRKYENEGLVLAHRSEAGRRLFCFEDIARVRHIHHLTQDLGLSIEAIRRLQALVPCWDLLPCSRADRRECPAFHDGTRPCWSIKGIDCPHQGNTCRLCPIYRFGSVCTEEIKDVLHDRADRRDAEPAIAALLDRRHPRTTET